MTSQGFSLIRGRVLRATRLDGCGNVVLGPDSEVTTAGFISVGLTANTQQGDAISVTNAAGDVCILDQPSPTFQNYSVEIAFCGVDPELVSLMTGQRTVLDADGTLAVGFRVNSKVNLDGQGFALEMWSGVPAAQCGESGAVSYGYFLLPFVRGGVLGDFTVANDAINFTMTGAATQDGNNWGAGPYDVVRDSADQPGPLNEPMDPDDHLDMEVTTVPPPAASVGGSAVGVAATGATAGIPATLTPSNSYAPANFASITGLTASPTTTWTAGQYVLLRDGSKAHWTGTAWASGPA